MQQHLAAQEPDRRFPLELFGITNRGKRIRAVRNATAAGELSLNISNPSVQEQKDSFLLLSTRVFASPRMCLHQKVALIQVLLFLLSVTSTAPKVVYT